MFRAIGSVIDRRRAAEQMRARVMRTCGELAFTALQLIERSTGHGADVECPNTWMTTVLALHFHVA